jgi:hypothetical protein
MDSCECSNGIRYYIIDARPDTEAKLKGSDWKALVPGSGLGSVGPADNAGHVILDIPDPRVLSESA